MGEEGLNAQEWHLRRFVSLEAREQVMIPLDPLVIQQLCAEVRKKGWEPVEGARTSWTFLRPDVADPHPLAPIWQLDASVFAVPESPTRPNPNQDKPNGE